MRRYPLFLAFWVLVAVGLVYANSFNNGFHFDDGHSIQDNFYLRSMSHFWGWFTDVTTFSPLAENRSYRPVLLVGFGISHLLGGGAPWAYHLLSLLLHTFGALCLGLLTRRLFAHSPRADFWGVFAALLFSVHAANSEAVNYISARSSLQAAVFMFASVLFWVKGREDNQPWARHLALLFLLLGLFTKLIAIMVPPVLLVWELLLHRQRDYKKLGLQLLPAVLASATFTVLHELLVGPYARGARSAITPWSHLLTQTRVWQRFVGLFVYPADLCADLTMRWSQVPWDGETGRAILWFFAVIATAFVVRRRWPPFSFGVAWFFLTLAPTNSVMPLSEPATEHRLYVALPGLIWAFCALAESLTLAVPASRRRWLLIPATLLVLVLGARTLLRNLDWRDDASLWGSVVECAPDNGRAHLNYGRGLLAQGDRVGARREYQRCQDLWPGYAYCAINLAALSALEGDLVAAEHHARRAVELAPNNVYSLAWLGRVLLESKRSDAARSYLEQAQKIAPGLADVRRDLALLDFEAGRCEAAVAVLKALPDYWDARARFALGLCAEATDATEAEAHYRAALAQDPREHRARYNLAVLLQRAGKNAEAITHYALLGDATHPDALFNWALACWQIGDLAQATALRSRLAAEAPHYPGLSALSF